VCARVRMLACARAHMCMCTWHTKHWHKIFKSYTEIYASTIWICIQLFAFHCSTPLITSSTFC